jgi:hypothetical protein
MVVLQTANAIIDALGGTVKTAKIARRSPQSVSNWRAANRLPAETFRRLTEKLREHGMEAPPELWGIE